MPVQTQTSKLSSKLGGVIDEKSLKEAFTEPPKTGGFQNLPGGIQFGVAALVKLGFHEYKADTTQKKAGGSSAAGEYYFRAVGVCRAPKTHIDPVSKAVVPCKGLQTSIMRNLFDTTSGEGANTKTVTKKENLLKVIDDMRLLVGDEYMKQVTIHNIETLALGIQKMALADKNKPLLFKFTTSDPTTQKQRINPKTGKPFPPKVFENWLGSAGLEGWKDVDEGNAFDESTGPGESIPVDESVGDTHHEPAPDEEVPGEVTPTEDEVDYDALGAAADAKKPDAEAKKALMAAAAQVGISKEDAENTNSWTELAEMIKDRLANGPTETEEAPAEDETPWVPEKGAVVSYARPGTSPTTKKPFTPFDCEVVDVSTKKETCKLKSLKDGKTEYKDVPFAQVSAKA